MDLDYFYNFYKNQSTQIYKLNSIKKWFSELENKTSSIILIGNTGIGKTVILNSFLKQCTLDVLDIAKLFELYENNNSYTTKDFIPKILKQKNICNFENIHKKKLLVIDSLEEFSVLQKGVIRELIDNIDNLNMSVIMVSESNSYDDLEKKLITKLKKHTIHIELEKPTTETMQYYIQSILKIDIDLNQIEKIIDNSRGDLRYLNNMIAFQKILPNSNYDFTKYFNENLKDTELELENIIKNFESNKLTDAFIKCESDPFIFGMLTYENYIYNNIKFKNIKKDYLIHQICLADQIEKNLFKHQQWEILEVYSYFSTLYPWKLLDKPKNILPSTTLQKFLNTKKRNKKYDLLF